jgi:dsDNA-binding SOS-regulon protein
MAVIIKYVVERNGEEKMTFTSKAEADAYDKMLDMADELFALLGQSQLIDDEARQEELALYLAQHKEDVLYALGAKRKPSPKKGASAKTETIEKNVPASKEDGEKEQAA